MTNRVFWNIAGWYGVIAVVAAYFLNNLLIINVESPAYIFLNLSGAVGLFVETYRKKDYQPMAINVVWASVAIYGLIKILLK